MTQEEEKQQNPLKPESASESPQPQEAPEASPSEESEHWTDSLKALPEQPASPWAARAAESVPPLEKKKPDLRLMLEIAMGVAVLVLLALLLFRPAAPAADAPETDSPPASVGENPGTVTVRFHSPEGTEKTQLAPGDLLTLEEAPVLDGYTFLRWRDADGQTVNHGSFRVWEDLDFYAVYAMALSKKEHSPYLALDEEGSFHPSGSISRREVICILYEMMDTKLVGDGQFLDVSETDAAYYPAATLKQLGILSGSRFHPDEAITRQEFLDILCGFFPEGTEKAAFSDLEEGDAAYPLFCTAAQQGWIESGKDVAARPDEELKRIDFVCILNRILNRHGDCDHRLDRVGTILDVSPEDPRFWDVAEAVIVHKHKGEGVEERWTSSEPLPTREEGLFFLGSRLHAIGPGGTPIVNGEYMGLFFNEDGIETSGLRELDELIWEVLDQQVDPSTMKQDEMLRRLFYYTVLRFSYRMGNYYPVGEPTGWEAQEALEMLQKRSGNCYSFAALFYELARSIGYNAKAYTGAVLGTQRDNTFDVNGETIELPPGHAPHGWVEIEFDGTWYIFDPEYSFLSVSRGNGLTFYKIGGYDRIRYGYLYSLDPEEQEAIVGPVPSHFPTVSQPDPAQESSAPETKSDSDPG